MNPTELSDRLRAADGIEVDDVDAIIAGAIQQGQQRRRVRQRVVPVLVGVVAIVTALGLAGILALRDGRSSTPVATTTYPPPSTASPSPGRLSPTSAEVYAIVEANIPQRLRVSVAPSSRHARLTEAEGRDAAVVVNLADRDGPARAVVVLRRGRGDPAAHCTREEHCRRITLAGRTVYEDTGWSGKGTDRRYEVRSSYRRSDGLVTQLAQYNVADNNDRQVTRPTTGREAWPLTRPTIPLTSTEVHRLLTAPEWDELAARCDRTKLVSC